MERKIGEIFECNGEWYQCVEANENDNCNACDLQGLCIRMQGKQHVGNCMNWRTDNKRTVYKKLEKVGEPYRRWLSPFNNIMVQRYRLYGRNVIMPDEPYMYFNAIDNTIEIELKQTKEDMEEKKLNLKPFDLQKAREGKPVCTRDGRKARIICFDIKGSTHPIIALIEKDEKEVPNLYMLNGKKYEDEEEWKGDLMMLPEKKEGWVNIYRSQIYNTPEKAKEAYKRICNDDNYLQTIKIEWEE